MMYLILALGALGLILTAASVIALVLEITRNKEARWQLLATSGTLYVLAFTTEPPAAWTALWHTEGASLPLALRSLALGVFMAALCRTHINKCKEGRL